MSLSERIKLWRELTRYEIEGRSMAPTLNPGDWILVRKVNPTNWELENYQALVGEIVVVVHNNRPQIKRISEVRVNQSDEHNAEIKQIEIFVLGDNADESTDSRHFGFIPAQSITGIFHRRYGKRNEKRAKKVNKYRS